MGFRQMNTITTPSESGPIQPFLRIPAGTHFGFRSGMIGRQQSRCLVETKIETFTGPGLHLLIAPNGAGKSTLLRTLAGLTPALSGNIERNGRVDYFSDDLRVGAELKPGTLFRSWLRGAALAKAHEFAELLKLDVRIPFGRLSRGNKQKMMLILAEVKIRYSGGPSLLLMDEPLSGLDIETRKIVAELWASSDTTAVRWVILHELESIQHADSLLTIHQGDLKQAPNRIGRTWSETYQTLQQ
jgi:ABC-2 type transport system ATP-binding protein/manganese/iron transport system ATP-binding protein